MSKAKEFSELYYNMVEAALRKGAQIKLAFDVEDIPKGSVVEVIKMTKKGGKIELELEAIDGSTVKVSYEEDKFPHKVVK